MCAARVHVVAGPAGAAKAASAASSDGSPVHDCLVRAVGSKQKISALITAKNYQRFMQSYGNILKVSLDSLKKREKKRLEKKGSTLVVEKQQPQRRSKGGSRPAAT